MSDPRTPNYEELGRVARKTASEAVKDPKYWERVARAVLEAANRQTDRETGWLIEFRMSAGKAPMWFGEWRNLDDEPSSGATEDHFKASRFCRKQDAELVIKALNIADRAFASEHVWIANRPEKKSDGELLREAMLTTSQTASPNDWYEDCAALFLRKLAERDGA